MGTSPWRRLLSTSASDQFIIVRCVVNTDVAEQRRSFRDQIMSALSQKRIICIAAPMSAFGTKRTYCSAAWMSAFEGKADMALLSS